MMFLGAKIRISEHRTKEILYFFVMSSESIFGGDKDTDKQA